MNAIPRKTAAADPITLSVEGMTCASCVRRVETAAAKVPGVAASSVNFASETLTVTPAAGFAVENLVEAIHKAGYEAKAERLELDIDEMTCASCVSRVEKALMSVPAVETANVNLATAKATVTVLGGEAQLPALIAAVDRAGYKARLVEPEISDAGVKTGRDREIRSLTRDFVIAAALTFPLFVMEMGGHIYEPFHHWLMTVLPGDMMNQIGFALATAVLLGPGLRFFSKGIPALLRWAPDMNSLVALGAGAAYLYSLVTTFAPDVLPYGAQHVYYEAATVIVTLILAGRLLEARAKGRTGEAIRRLVGLQAKTARVERQGQVLDIPTSDVVTGDILVIRPGERIPVDGSVIDGHSAVDEAMISGEPVPVEKGPGATVIGGTINGSGSFRFTAEKVGADTMLSQIIRMVGEAQGSKLPIQAMVDRVTGWFVPVVMGIAALTFVAWLILGPEPAYTYGLVAAVAVLIIACPCAMGLATPTSIMVGTGRAAEFGVLFRKGEALQLLSEADTIVLDKTGTITLGRPELTDVIVAEGFDERDVLALAASLEARSEHPLADAIVRGAEARGIGRSEVTGFAATVGYGISGEVSGRKVFAGAARFMEKLGVDIDGIGAAAASPPHPASASLGHPLPEGRGVVADVAAASVLSPEGKGAAGDAAASSLFSPAGRRWSEGPDEGGALRSLSRQPDEGQSTDGMSLRQAAETLAAQGRTPLYIAIDGRAAAAIAVADPVKETSAAAVTAFRRLGLTVVMVTGDARATAEAVGKAVGIDRVVAETLPEGKVEAIRALQAEGRKVAFVGDGINDAPALATADTGIAIGTGTDVAIESADVVLVGGDLAGAVHAIEIGRKVIRNIRENLVWAFGYNVALIPVAAGVLYPHFGLMLSPMIGAGAMGLSSVFVVGNALRLKRARVSEIGREARA